MTATNGDTYQAPVHGWTCFQCGETFTKPGAARDHFGGAEDEPPACIMFDELGTRGVLMAYRRAMSLARRQTAEVKRLQYLLGSAAADYQRITGLRTAHDARFEIDSLEGRALAAEAIVADIATRWPALVDASRARICQLPRDGSNAEAEAGT